MKPSLSAKYSNSSCNKRVRFESSGKPAPQFPNEEYCGPKVTLGGSVQYGSAYTLCNITTTYKFPNLKLLETHPGGPSEFPGCKIVVDKKSVDLILEKPNEFFTFVDSFNAIAHSSVVWENDECPPQGLTIVSIRPISPFTYFNYCGKYTISADSVYPSPQGNCTVKSDEYPIPNWNITKTDTGCIIRKVD